MKKHFKFIGIVALVVFAGFTIFTHSAFAGDGLVPCGPGKSDSTCDVCDFFVLIDNIIDFISIDIAPYLALLLIIGGAVTMMVSGGSETVYKKGKEIITTALIGLFIIWGSWLIIDIIMSATLVGTSGSSWTSPWYTIKCQ